jgi:hypothetical protein
MEEINMKEKIKYTPGEKFGKLTFIEEDFHEKEITGFQKYRKAVVECFCGKKFITRISGLRNGKVKSCGCIRKDKLSKRITRHNMSTSSEYASWEAMKSRCLNSKNRFYYNYGGRGIKVCEEWLDFKNFIKDMGNKPNKNYSIERINVNGNYCPENCKWSDRYEQDRNRRNSVKFFINGEYKILMDIARENNLHQQTIKSRLLKGMTIKEAIDKQYKYTKK